MATLSLHNLALRPAQLKAVEKKARRSGKTAPEYIRSLIESDLLSDKSFNDILRPIRQDIDRRRITENQLDELVDLARKSSPRKSRKPTK